jgi:fumarate reductase subunit D
MILPKKIIFILTTILLILFAFSSYQGVFNPKTFEKDSLSFGTQGIGQDFVNLFVVVPLLLISYILFRNDNKTGSYLFGGTLFYILYSYMIYAFGVNFNHLFLVYCAILGLSLYTFILFIFDFVQKDISSWFKEKLNPKPMSIYMLLIAALFYMLWLKDVIPALINNTTPESVTDNNLLVNPVHVLDLAIALPACFISAILLLKNHKMGFIFAPIILLFIVILTIALIGMVIALKIKGVSEDISLVYIFGILSFIGMGFLYNFNRKLK